MENEMSVPTVIHTGETGTYKILFVSGTDFAIQKEMKTMTKTLVYILGKNLFFIYDEKKKTKEDIRSFDALSSFFRNMLAEEVIFAQGTLNYMADTIHKRDLQQWYDECLIGRPARKFLMKKGVSLHLWDWSRTATNENETELFAKAPKLYEELMRARSIDINFIYEVYKMFGFDIARYAIEKAKALPAEPSIYYPRVSLGPMKDFNGRRAIDYLFELIYEQGETQLPSNNYIDYLNLCITMDGCVKNKYPKDMLTMHNIYMAKQSDAAEISNHEGTFKFAMEEYCEKKNLAYQNPFDEYAIIVPQAAEELVDEGIALAHCVAVYVEKVAKGECVVVFMRKKKTPDESLLTVEVLPDNTVSQIEGLQRRTDFSDEEALFLYRWAKFCGLTITDPNLKPMTDKIERERKEKEKEKEKEKGAA